MNQIPEGVEDMEMTIWLVLQKLIAKDIESKLIKNSSINWVDYVFEEDVESLGLIGNEELFKVPADFKYLETESQDSLVEVNIGTKQKTRITYVSTKLEKFDQSKIVELFKEYRDYFARV